MPKKQPSRPPMLLADCTDCDGQLRYLESVGGWWCHLVVDAADKAFGVGVHPNSPEWLEKVDREKSDPEALKIYDKEIKAK